MSEQDPELEAFSKFIVAIEPWLGEVVLVGAAERLFGKIDDTIREAALMAAGRELSPEKLAETAQAGLKEVFGGKAA
jgi:hypothetical protein